MTERQRWEARADVGMRTQKYGFFAENYLARVTDNKFCVDPELLIRKYSQYLLPEDNGNRWEILKDAEPHEGGHEGGSTDERLRGFISL